MNIYLFLFSKVDSIYTCSLIVVRDVSSTYMKNPTNLCLWDSFYAFCSASFLKNSLFSLSTIADKAPSPEMLHAVPKLS